VKASFRIEDVDKVEATMEITMLVSDWRDLSRKIRGANTTVQEWPVSTFLMQIERLIFKASQSFDEVEAGVER